MTGRLYGLTIGILAVSMLGPVLCAFIFREKQALVGFMISFLFASFFAVASLLVMQSRAARFQPRGREALLLQFIVLWFLMPVFAAIPFVFGQGFGFVNAYFEAVSAITTTGASVVDYPDELLRSLLLWRSILQWLGGLATLIMIAVFFQPMKLIEMGQGLPFLPHGGDSYPAGELQQIILILLVPYISLTILGSIALAASGLSIFHAMCMSLSLLSTGGFLPSQEIAPSFFGNLIIVTLMLMGAINFSYYCNAIRGNFRFYRGISEILLFLCLWLTAAIFLGISFHYTEAIGWLKSMAAGLFASASLLSTTAILPLGEFECVTPLPLLLLLPVLGGCCFSTSGGFKLARVMLIARDSLCEIGRLIHPSSVDSVSTKDATAGMRGIWAYFGAFLLCLVSGTILLSLVGFEFLPALTAVIAALTNAGPMLHYLDPGIVGAHSYGNLAFFGKGVLILLMIAGRVEILLLLCLFLPAYWRA